MFFICKSIFNNPPSASSSILSPSSAPDKIYDASSTLASMVLLLLEPASSLSLDLLQATKNIKNKQHTNKQTILIIQAPPFIKLDKYSYLTYFTKKKIKRIVSIITIFKLYVYVNVKLNTPNKRVILY